MKKIILLIILLISLRSHCFDVKLDIELQVSHSDQGALITKEVIINEQDFVTRRNEFFSSEWPIEFYDIGIDTVPGKFDVAIRAIFNENEIIVYAEIKEFETDVFAKKLIATPHIRKPWTDQAAVTFQEQSSSTDCPVSLIIKVNVQKVPHESIKAEQKELPQEAPIEKKGVLLDLGKLQEAIAASNLEAVDTILDDKPILEANQRIALLDFAQNMIETRQIQIMRQDKDKLKDPKAAAPLGGFFLLFKLAAVATLFVYMEKKYQGPIPITLTALTWAFCGYCLYKGGRAADAYEKGLEKLRLNAIAIKRKLYALNEC